MADIVLGAVRLMARALVGFDRFARRAIQIGEAGTGDDHARRCRPALGAVCRFIPCGDTSDGFETAAARAFVIVSGHDAIQS